MHFITGGAYNGKAEWTRRLYQDRRKEVSWFSAYTGGSFPEPEAANSPAVVLEGLEQWIRLEAEQNDAQDVRADWQVKIRRWLEWENETAERSLILIGTDIMKGIVPVEAAERRWRDACGWIYQDLAASAERADVIWYGLNQRLK